MTNDVILSRFVTVARQARDFQIHNMMFRVYTPYSLRISPYDCSSIISGYIDVFSFGIYILLDTADTCIMFASWLRNCAKRFLSGDFGEFYAEGDIPVVGSEYGSYSDGLLCVWFKRELGRIVVFFPYEH